VTSCNPLIHLDDVELSLEDRIVLSGVTLSTDARRLAVLGRNGSGKSTLARLMAGLHPPTRGNVQIGGVDVARDRRGALSSVGILFQNPDHQIIFPTVAEELGFGLSQMGMDRPNVHSTVAKTLAAFGKQSWADAAVHQLSQGQRQLVCLMAIIAMAPKVIILDEPFSGLDIPTAMHLERILARTQAALVHITHDPDAVMGYDHAVWIEGGKIAHQGALEDVVPVFTQAMHKLGAGDDLTHLTG